MTATQVASVTDTGEDHGHGSGLYVALVPWVLFPLLAQHSTLKVAAVIAFLGFTVVAFAADHAAPFTDQYARDSVPRQFWSSPTFKATNRRLTTMWALVFTAMVPFHVLAGVIDRKPTNILFNWVVPIGLIVWGAKRTDAITASVKSSA